MPVSKFLAADFGAETGRVIVGILNDDKISLDEVHRFPNTQTKTGVHIHWDVPYLFGELKKGLSLAVQQGHGDIESIGIDTWGVDFGLLDKRGQLIESPFAYRDPRTNGMMDKVFEKIPREEIYSLTGIQFMQINSLFQLYSVAIERPEMLAGCGTLLFMPDLFNYFLTGQKASEYTIASTSQLLNAQTRNWDETLFAKLGMPLRIMAPIVHPGSVIGRLLPEVAREVGLSKTVDVIAVGCHDTASAVAA
ncbi:MAG: FGGY family carbohydrate kinase, partial [bacterium]